MTRLSGQTVGLWTVTIQAFADLTYVELGNVLIRINQGCNYATSPCRFAVQDKTLLICHLQGDLLVGNTFCCHAVFYDELDGVKV